MRNFVTIRTLSSSVNVAYLRSCIGAFCVQLNPSLEEINDVKTAVSEAVTNAVVHAYRKSGTGEIVVTAEIKESAVYIDVVDFGCGIADIETAKRAFFTTAEQDERSGLGFTVMETFMDSLEIRNNPDGGLTVSMSKKFHDCAAHVRLSEGDLSVRAQ